MKDRWIGPIGYLPSHSLTMTNPFLNRILPVLYQPWMHPYKGTNPRTEYKSQSAKDFVDEIKKVRLEAESALKQTAEMMKKFYDRKKSDSREYSIRDKVWLEGMNITTTRPSKKLGDKRYGPFVICHELAICLLFFYLFLFFSFSFGTYLTSCSNGTLNPAYSRP